VAAMGEIPDTENSHASQHAKKTRYGIISPAKSSLCALEKRFTRSQLTAGKSNGIAED